MKPIATELQTLIDLYLPLVSGLAYDELDFKPSPAKWSKKEIIGHLIDSAQNNLRRFIVSQYEETPAISYDQDKWVSINDYQRSETADLINLWYLLNKQIVFVLRNTLEEMAKRTCKTKEIYTIEWLAKDYIKHLKHHIHQVIDLEPVAYP
jgi:hypothetical protein